ncbi:MAG: hypothetical protein JSR60_07970 [Proteobacteria bacterium]|nr:hypothetical protein [Pseudomonadota bacterium]
MVRKILLLACAVMLSGCVSTKVVGTGQDAVDALHGAPLTTVTYTKPDFVASTWGRAGLIGGITGALVMISEGNQLVKDDDIPDPADAIVTQLGPEFAAKFGGPTQPAVTLRKRDNDGQKDLAALAQNHGVVFDVQSTAWSFIYFPFDWTHYRVVYSVRARLIDASTGTVIGQVPCTYQSDDKNPPDYDQLTGNHGELLKSLLAKGTEACIQIIRSNMFK